MAGCSGVELPVTVKRVRQNLKLIYSLNQSQLTPGGTPILVVSSPDIILRSTSRGDKRKLRLLPKYPPRCFDSTVVNPSNGGRRDAFQYQTFNFGNPLIRLAVHAFIIHVPLHPLTRNLQSAIVTASKSTYWKQGRVVYGVSYCYFYILRINAPSPSCISCPPRLSPSPAPWPSMCRAQPFCYRCRYCCCCCRLPQVMMRKNSRDKKETTRQMKSNYPSPFACGE